MLSSSNCSSLLISSRRLAVAGVVQEEATSEETGSVAEDGNGRDADGNGRELETGIAGVLEVGIVLEVVSMSEVVVDSFSLIFTWFEGKVCVRGFIVLCVV